MIYVLIIMTWFTGYVDGFPVHTQEFSSQLSCEAAATRIVKEVDKWRVNTNRVVVFCVPK